MVNHGCKLRALGNRSILADPSDPRMKDHINEVVKFREEFRPYCPSVTLEDASTYFVDSCESPYMTAIFEVREDKRGCIPAVTHVDGTARIQTVRRDLDPLYWKLLKAFEFQSGVAVLLNTSMNVRYGLFGDRELYCEQVRIMLVKQGKSALKRSRQCRNFHTF